MNKPSSLPEGRLLQQYRLDALLGQGGMGTVFRATDTQLERTVAVKMLHPHLLSQGSFMERFRNEALILARLNHPNLAVLFNLLKEGQDQFMVMEYVEGDSLEKLVQKTGPLPPAVASELLRQGLEGLQHAHRKGILHRDIKPANLMLTPEGVVKLMDFGIARVVGGERLTQVNRVVGTLEYMAPELLQGQEPSPASDLYAMGILLYELLTGKIPFESRTDHELIQAIIHQKPRSLRKFNEKIPKELEAVVCKALEKNPAHRFSDAMQFQKALHPFFFGSPLPDQALIASLNPLPMTDVLDIQPKRSEKFLQKKSAALAGVGGAATRWVWGNGQLLLTGLILLTALVFVGLILSDVSTTPSELPQADSTAARPSVAIHAENHLSDPDSGRVSPLHTSAPTQTTDPEPREIRSKPTVPLSVGIVKRSPPKPNSQAPNETHTEPIQLPTPTQTVAVESVEEPVLKSSSRKSLVIKRVRVRLALLETLSSAQSHEGQAIRFRVTDPVVNQGEVVIEAGATAYGEVTRIKRAAGDFFRKKDLLEFQIRSVEAITGQRFPLRSATFGEEAKGQPV
ncbi:MAG: serine/threonine protein kinase, partial [Sphingobacteriaceae bacterium]|nr:serine/threonine protein kinase [Cytophagaceae bacterium]